MTRASIYLTIEKLLIIVKSVPCSFRHQAVLIFPSYISAHRTSFTAFPQGGIWRQQVWLQVTMFTGGTSSSLSSSLCGESFAFLRHPGHFLCTRSSALFWTRALLHAAIRQSPRWSLRTTTWSRFSFPCLYLGFFSQRGRLRKDPKVSHLASRCFLERAGIVH